MAGLRNPITNVEPILEPSQAMANLKINNELSCFYLCLLLVQHLCLLDRKVHSWNHMSHEFLFINFLMIIFGITDGFALTLYWVKYK